jgi:hypothetical protein
MRELLRAAKIKYWKHLAFVLLLLENACSETNVKEGVRAKYEAK